MIGDGRSLTGLSLDAWARSAKIVGIARRAGVQIPPLDAVSDAEPVAAIISLGTWKVECPDPGCFGAVNVWREGPALFFCPMSGNRSSDGLWRRVTMPEPIEAAETELLGHPEWLHLTWRPE